MGLISSSRVGLLLSVLIDSGAASLHNADVYIHAIRICVDVVDSVSDL